MSWTTFGTHTAGDPLLPSDGDKISKNVEQLAKDIYISPVSGDDGIADLAYPLEKVTPIFTSHVSGNGSTGVVVTLPATYTPASVDDYEVFLSWQEDPGSNGLIWAEKTTSNFTIKHSGSETGKKIGYLIIRKTV